MILLTAATVFADYSADIQALASDKTSSDTGRLKKLFDIEWSHSMLEYPEFATSVGFPGQDGRWTDNSIEAIKRREAQSGPVLEILKGIDRSKLSKADQLNYDLYRRDVEMGIEGDKFPGEYLVMTQLGGVHSDIAQTLEAMPRATVENYENILSRLRGSPKLIDQNIELLKLGMAAGVTPPKVTLGALPDQIKALIKDDALKSPVLVPFTDFPSSIPPEEQARLKEEAVRVFNEQVRPALQKLHDYVAVEYLPKTRESVGWNGLPNGEAWYAYRVRSSTTTDLSPEKIHEIGLSEVKRIRGEMDKIIAEVKFKGGFKEFLAFLRTDPQFYYNTPEELLAGYRDIAKRIDPELAKQFGVLPRLTYGVKAIPDYSAKSSPAAYYYSGSEKAGRPGWFVANTYALKSRPKWQMECLTLHEAVPGHHLQISLAQEQGEVPEFRKHNGYTAFVEGWGLYAESLGGDLGLYKDPYSRFGALSFELWRAIRLVVDTGVHFKGWSRDEALKYMNETGANSEIDNEIELNRYIVWPAQALAYKIGQLKIRELRNYAQAELGDKFDIRAFHDTVLANGALPLDTLETVIKEWVQAQQKKGN